MLANKLRHCQLLLFKYERTGKSDDTCLRLFEIQLDRTIRVEIIQKFLSFFSDDKQKQTPEVIAKSHRPFLDAVEFLKDSCQVIEDLLKDGNFSNLKNKFLARLRVEILSQKPYYLKEYLNATYLRAFKAFLILNKSKSDRSEQCLINDGIGIQDEDEDIETEILDGDMESDSYDDSDDQESLYKRFCDLNEFLRRFKLLEDLIEETVINVSRIFIERRVLAKSKSSYSYSYLHEMQNWVDLVVKRWIFDLYRLHSNETNLREIYSKLDLFLRDAYAEVRKSHMFEIIIEYPNSEAGIQDLKMCLEQASSPDFRLNLIESVKQSLTESLLHPGVNTYDILTAYISAIKALRALDPSGLILQLITEPIRRYLKSRDDTVRCIVSALTDEDSNSELNREMIRTGTQGSQSTTDGKLTDSEMTILNEGERCTVMNYETWRPDPIKVNSSDDVMKSSRFSDIVSILVNIYETKDRFVEEYQKLLSQRLLNKYDECNLDMELRNLELLTMRFSDCELHRCEVMLKDVNSSKRINKRILSGEIKDNKLDGFKNLDVLIVSSPFWPEKFSPMATTSDNPPRVPFPPEIEAAIKTYTKAFEALQASRTLHWRHHLGSVNLDLTINGKTQNFVVSPLHASLLYLFKEKKSWRLSELMLKTSLPAATLRSRLTLWQRNGIIRDSGEDKFDLII